MRGFLLDEHLPTWWASAITSLRPELTIWYVSDGIAPNLGSEDPVLLEWCETFEAILVTNNRSTMPGHLAERIEQGRHISGVFIIPPHLDITVLATTLAHVAGAMLPNEFQDQIVYPPLIVD